jgi:hypothetical protein
MLPRIGIDHSLPSAGDKSALDFAQAPVTTGPNFASSLDQIVLFLWSPPVKPT